MDQVRKMYRGGKVWVEVDDHGQPVTSSGLVQIRYRQDDERSYSARASEIEDIDETKLQRKKAAGSGGGRSRKAAPRQRKAATSGVDADALPPGTVIVFTDGACYGNPGPAGVGILLEWKGQTKEISRYIGEGTNNIAELAAIRDGLQAIKNRRPPVRLFTDSSYAIGVLALGWKVNENRELVAEIKRLMEGFADLELIKVRGHAGDPRNERADQLARDGIDHRQGDGGRPDGEGAL